MDSVVRFVSKIIFWIEAVDGNWNEKFIIYLIICIYLKVLEKIDWNTFFNNIIRYQLDMTFFLFILVCSLESEWIV